jgi:hypothetical protein
LPRRQQINVLRRTAPKRPRFGSIDRLIFVGLFRGLSTAHDALAIVQPDTVIRWHRAGSKALLALEIASSRGQADPAAGSTPLDPCDEPCQSALGRTRMHGELLKLGIDVGQTSVTKYMARRRRPPSQRWRTFLCNHADGIVAMDCSWFQLLYGLLIPRHDRCRVLWMGVTPHPTAEAE